MVEFRVLGTVQVTAPDRPEVQGLPHQTKRIALLAYLAVAVPRGDHRRDRLLALFWPELDDRRARAALSQALYVLRSTLGEETVTSRGEGPVGLKLSALWCDAVAFERALDEGRIAEALALYRGDLLEGFFLSDSPEFEHWLDAERERLRQRAVEAAWSLAEIEVAAGHAFDAVRWAEWAVDHRPTDEAAVRRLMLLYRTLGNRVSAVKAYRTFVERLKTEYDLEPSVETVKLASSMRDDGGSDAVPTPAGTRRVPAIALPSPGRERLRALRWIAGAVVLALVLALSARTWIGRRGDESPQVVRLALELPSSRPLASGVPGSRIALAPDGSRLVYVGQGDGGTQLFVRAMAQIDVLPLPHTLGAHLPFLSADGRWLGFVAGDAIQKMPLDGGPAITVARVSTNVPGVSWGSNDVIVFATPAGLWKVSADGGEAMPLILSDTARGERYRWPEVLPSGQAVVFTRVDSTGFHLDALSVETGVVVPLGLEGTNPRFVPPGHLVYGRPDGALLVVPFDARNMRVTGAVRPVADNVVVGIGGAAAIGVSATGTLAYLPEASGGRTVAVVDRTGRAEVVRVPAKRFGTVRISPDGQRAVAVVSANGEQSDLWLIDLEVPALRRLTFDSGAVMPVWAPDGGSIVYAAKPAGRPFGMELRVIGLDGSAPTTLLRGAVGQFPRALTPDGRTLVFELRRPDTGRDVWLLSLDGDREAQPYAAGPFDEYGATLAPDGQWLAYVSARSGQDEVYVGRLAEPGRSTQVSVGGGQEPRWALNGRELFYRNDRGIVAVPIDPLILPQVGQPSVVLDDTAYVRSPGSGTYDPFPDGRAFLLVRRGPESHDVELVLNWLGIPKPDGRR